MQFLLSGRPGTNFLSTLTP